MSAGLLVFAGLPLALYVIAQLAALLRLRGHARVWALLPIPFMAWVAWVTISAFQQQLNLWPIALVLLTPVALLYLGVVALIARAKR